MMSDLSFSIYFFYYILLFLFFNMS